jgi:Transglutaminase-like enzymes, putative cysteine proteases
VTAAGTDPSATTRQQRLGIRHRTGYRYAGDVVMSYNEARMTPLTTPWQTTLEARIEVAPSATTYRYWDYWGTQVTGFDVRDPHDRLEVTARSVVETHPAITVTSEQTVAWSELGSAVVLDRFAELLAPTTRCAVGDEAVELARVVVQGLDPVQAGRAVAEWLAELLDYVPGATGVHTSAMQAWQGGKGVCQDFAHIATGVLRRLGIPARYVSGYLLPLADAPVGEQVRGESHAWIEWWSGDWQAWDPTNGRPAGADHVVVARARDYDDVTPLKGIYSGPGGGELFVSVEFTRLA